MLQSSSESEEYFGEALHGGEAAVEVSAAGALHSDDELAEDDGVAAAEPPVGALQSDEEEPGAADTELEALGALRSDSEGCRCC